jgi:hypothetical protein
MPIAILHVQPQQTKKERITMHWTERRRARVNLALGLQARGWRLYGFKEDQSDPMTDYYHPASWDGIAEKEGADGSYVVVVDVKPGNETILKRSGGYETSKRVPGDNCPHCHGSGKEPDGWTYQDALAKPHEFNLDHTSRQTPGAVPLMADVVSPLHFDASSRAGRGKDGEEKCVRCNGLGHTWKLEDATVDWPRFRANPNRKLWHVEQDGRILDSGIGLGPCADWDQEKAQAAVERIVNRIEAAINASSASTAAPSATTVGEVTIRRNLEKNGIEVIFPAKPDAETRRRLGSKKRGRLGFRWSRRQNLWYARYSTTLWEQVHQLLNAADDPADQDESGPDEVPNPLLDAAVQALTTPVPEPEPPTVPTIPPSRAGPAETAQIALF